MHRRFLVIAYGLKGVSEGALEHTGLPYTSPSQSSTGWGLLRARTSFTENLVPECLPTEQRERYDVDLPFPLHPPQQLQHEQE